MSIFHEQIKQATPIPQERTCTNENCFDGWVDTGNGMARCPDCHNRVALQQIGLKTWGEIKVEHDSWKVAKAYSDQCKDWVRMGLVLVLIGVKGTGKTQAAYLIKQDARKAGFSATSIKWFEWFEEYMDCWGRRGQGTKTSNEMVKALLDADLLIIDELMAVLDKPEQEQRALHRIIDARYEQNKSTIITGNLNGTQFKDLLGDRAFARVQARMDSVVFDGPVYRKEIERAQVKTLIDRIRERAG